MPRDDVVEIWLRNYCTDIVPDKSEREVARDAHQELRALLNTGEMARRITRTYLSGSYVRHTATSPINDVDVVCEINPERWRDSSYDDLPSPDAVLNTFATAIRNRLREVDDPARVRKQGRSVGVIYDEIKVDVVPAVSLDEGEDDEEPIEDDGETEDEDDAEWEDLAHSSRVLIPDRRNDEWIESNPRAHVRIAATLNKSSGGLFKPAVRLMKTWNEAHGRYVSSFVIETLTAHAFSAFGFTSLPAACAATWNYIAIAGGLHDDYEGPDLDVVLKDGWTTSPSIPDLAGVSDLAAGCAAKNLEKLVAKAARARDALATACRAHSDLKVHEHLSRIFRVEDSEEDAA